MNPADHMTGGQILDTIRRCNEQQLMIAELCDRHKNLVRLARQEAFGHGMLAGGALMGLIAVWAYMLGGLEWLR